MILTFECSLIGISHCPVWFTCFQSKTFQNPIFQPFFVGWWKNTPPQEAERTLDDHPTPALMLDNSMTLWISMFCGSHPHACWNFETNSAEHISISISIFSLAMSPCYLQPPSCVEIKNTLMASLGGPARNESSLIFSILRCLVLNPYTIPILKNVLRPFHRRFQRFRGTSARPAPQEAVRRPRLPQRTVAVEPQGQGGGYRRVGQPELLMIGTKCEKMEQVLERHGQMGGIEMIGNAVI